MSLTLTAQQRLSYLAPIGLQSDTLDSGTLIHTQVEGGQRGTRL